MRGSRALMLRFAAPLALPFDAAFVNYGPLRWIARDSSKPGRGGTETWLLHANAAWSEVHIDEDAQTVAELLLAAFVELGGRARRRGVRTAGVTPTPRRPSIRAVPGSPSCASDCAVTG